MLRRPLSMVCLMMIVLLYLGTRFTASFSSPYEEWEGKPVTVVGRVYRKECTHKAGKERKVLYLQLISANEDLHFADTVSDRQKIICYLQADEELPKTGSIVTIKGLLKNFEKSSNPGQFDAESYYHILKLSFQLNQTEIQAKSETYSIFRERLFEIREYYSRVLDYFLPQTEASLMKTMLLGEKGTDAGQKALYQRNGIAHVLAISGLHISLLGMTVYKLLKKAGCPIAISTAMPVAVMVFYGFLTGFSVSSARAIIMFGIHMLALLCKRTYDLITAAFVAAVLLLVDQPLYLYSSSFLFSFGCIFAIGFLVPALTKELSEREKQPGKILTSFLSASAITMAGIPMQLSFFYQMPLYSALLNLLVIPLMSFVLPAGILLIFLYEIPLIREAAVVLITGILAIFEGICRFAEKLPFHTLLPGKPGNLQIIFYMLVMLAVVMLKNKVSLWKRWLIALCGVMLFFLPGQSKFTVTFLDVGQGDCIHVKTAENNHYLIDGGSSTVSQVGTYRIIPYLKAEGANVIEAVFITHPDEDHCNGLVELLQTGKEQGIEIKKLCLPDIGEQSKTEAYMNLVLKAREAGIPVYYIHRGQAFSEEEFTLLCLHPKAGYESRDPNEYSMVLYLQFQGFTALFTGDVEGNGEEKLLQSLKDMGAGKYGDISPAENGVTVLKVAHHGSADSTPTELLKQIRPRVAVISCGKNNRYGHPHKETLERLESAGSRVFGTPEYGAITVEVDENIRIRGFKGDNN